MNAVAQLLENDSPDVVGPAAGPPAWDERVLDEMSTVLFASLRRSDQRLRGAEYLRGLLGAQGRRSIRNMASRLGGSATEQSLHHFVSDSTWDWAPVRRTLARHIAEQAPPFAYVVRPMVIPKTGENSVGVDRQFVSELGQLVNAQQAAGVWSATEQMSVPINWRLHLSASWLGDRARRRQASIPDDVWEQTPGDGAVEAALETASQWGLPQRPVVLDARHMDLASAIARFRAAGVPFLARINGSLQLAVTDPALQGRTPEVQQAVQIMTAARDRMRPAPLPDEGGARAGRPLQLTTKVRVRPSRAVRQVVGQGELALLGVAEARWQKPVELWLTDMTQARLPTLVRLSRLIRRADRDFRETTDRLGIRDFTGRSYAGWHRHVTLASAAHAVSMLGAPGEGATEPA
ncbi:transposase [Streptomyces sp. CBMA152]|uniref:IS701 family transposase n=1 Tax=Streptomyces sp. CBMA152 TaxID=1896312 RepID=UPI001CB701C6|nr:transposase [Streptomyces sp. CBMA152]